MEDYKIEMDTPYGILVPLDDDQFEYLKENEEDQNKLVDLCKHTIDTYFAILKSKKN